jgi:hypothetical protein
MTKPSGRIALLAALASLGAAAPAFAGGPLANCSSGQPYLWAAGGTNIPFNPDQGDLGPLTNANAVALVQQAFDVWGAIPTSTLSYANAGSLPVDVDITNFAAYLTAPAPDGLSAIVFDDTGEIFDLLYGPSSGILGFAGPEWGNSLTCTIEEGLSFLNGPAFTDPTYALDVMVHEFGHYSNFAHTVVNGQVLGFADASGPSPFNTFGPIPVVADDVIETMYPFYFGPTSGTNSLERDDVAIASTLYPEAGFLASTGTIAGTIYAPNATTKLTGVNVIARNVADPFNDAASAISSDFTDSTDQADPVVGTYRINGLTPGAEYAVFVDEILAGGFSTTPLAPLAGPEEFHNGANESADGSTDDPSVYTAVTAMAGAPATGIDVIFNAPPPGVLPITDDGFAEVFMPFPFQICGQTYNSVFVNGNGNLTFGSPDSDFSESVAEFLNDQPRIAPLWDDLNPAGGGVVSYSQTDNTLTVRFDAVPEFPAIGANTFAVTLKRASNHVDIVYGDLSAADGLAGVSCGGAITSRFETEDDLGAFAPSRINLKNQPARYELFTAADPNDLANTAVLFNGTTSYNDNWAGKNDSLASARNIKLPFDSIATTRYTEIAPTGGDVDFYAFNASAGTTLLLEVLTGSLDTFIGLFDSAGNLVAADDDGGAGLLSRIVYPVATGGRYYLAVSTFPDTDFSGDGASGGRYVLDLSAINGILLSLGDDASLELPLGFTFPFNGTDYTSVFVNSNGNLTFGSGDTDFSESVTELLNDQPRIAALWDDLSPNNGGRVIADGDSSSMTVTFMDVPEFPSTGSNTFSVTMLDTGDVIISYGGVTATDGLAGLSEGGGAVDPGATDLSAGGPFNRSGTTYELFNAGNPFDLDDQALSFDQ